MKKIAIQGIKGSFHDIAAHQYYKDEEVELICCDTFEDIFSQMRDDYSRLGLMAIENTIAGSLLHNYELLREDEWDTITEVNSHPVALMQCHDFLKKHPNIKVVEAEDTAGSAEMISRKHLRGHAAICHAGAAPLYGMKVLEQGIEDNKHNFTRFLLMCDPWSADKHRDLHHTNKSSIVFSLPHEEGSLSQVLSIFSFYKINLTKIQSLPIIGREWEYLFYVDVAYDDYVRYRQSIDAVRPLLRELKILGEYNAK